VEDAATPVASTTVAVRALDHLSLSKGALPGHSATTHGVNFMFHYYEPTDMQ
jgi:hypothetical protein